MGDPFVKPGLSFRRDIEHVMLRNEGTGTSNKKAADWATDQYRDTLSTLIQRRDLLVYTSCSMGMCTARARHNMLEKMVDPLYYSARGENGQYVSSITTPAVVLHTNGRDATGQFEMPMLPNRIVSHNGDKRPRE